MAWLIDNRKLGTSSANRLPSGSMKNLAEKQRSPYLITRNCRSCLNEEMALRKPLRAPNAKIVAETSAINPAEGISKMETIFQSNPNVKVVGCIGGGGSVAPMKRPRQETKSQTTSASSQLMQPSRNFSLSRTMRRQNECNDHRHQ